MSSAKVDVKVDVFQKAAEAARNAGAAYPEIVAEYILPRLSVVESLGGPQVMSRNGWEPETLGVTMMRLKESQNVGPLFDAKLNVKTMDHELYVAIRKHKPELLGLRKKRRFA